MFRKTNIVNPLSANVEYTLHDGDVTCIKKWPPLFLKRRTFVTK